MKETEVDLVISAKGGNQPAMEALFVMNREKIFSLAFQYVGNRQDAEDLLQEVFFRAFGALRTFDPHKGAAFSTWLYRIGINTSINFLRKRKLESKIRQPEEHLSLTTGCPPTDPEQEMLSDEISQRLERGLNELSPRQRMVVVLKHYQGLKVKEIAGMMKCSEGSVKKQLFRAVRGLKKKLTILYQQGAAS
jgi:RNA polymerase sigma-70 factor (ECF subfamily)